MSAGEQMAEGGKQKAGGVPEGWHLENFGNIATFRNGLNFVQSSDGEAVKIIGVADFQQNRRFSDTGSLKSVRVKDKLRADDILKLGDLLFVRSNGNKDLIGRCMVIDIEEGERTSFSGFTIRARLDSSALPELIAELFSTSFIRKQLSEAGSGTNIANLSQDILAKIQLLLPPLPEQRKIAAILCTWDDALATLTHLLAAKRQQKRGLAEALLTGKTRLKGFASEWEETRLGRHIFEVSQRNSNSTIDRVLSVTNHSGFVLPEEQFSKRVASENIS